MIIVFKHSAKDAFEQRERVLQKHTFKVVIFHPFGHQNIQVFVDGERTFTEWADGEVRNW